jgi:hypothetical protein
VTATLRYLPADPSGVASIDRMRLYTSPTRTGAPVADTTTAVVQPDGAWLITLPDQADGTYYARTTVHYADGTVLDDVDDIVTFPLLTAAQPGDPMAPWVTAAELAADSRLATLTPAALALAAQTATEILWALSGRTFGGLRSSRVLVLPPACGCDGSNWVGRSDMWGASSNLGGLRWLPWGWGCGCLVTLDLPDQPVRSIVRVALDDVTLDPAGYRLDDGGKLVRVDGQLWPLFASGYRTEAAPRMQVVYLWGTEPPAAGRLAAQVYATELALAAAGSSDCRLPDRVTSITRQDVIKTFGDPLQLVEHGLTGLTSVDQWTRSVNPHNQTGTRPRVLSPDVPRVRSTT